MNEHMCKLINLSIITKTMTSLLVPPASVRGALILDREAFTQNLKVPYIGPCKNAVLELLPQVKRFMLKLPNFKALQVVEDGIIVYLDPVKIKLLLEAPCHYKHFVLGNNTSFEEKEITLKYENFTAGEILSSIIPKDIEVPTSFSVVGHILHLNLKDPQLPYSKVIGQVFLDKIPNISTVVNKLNTIDNTFRYFNMEILAGIEDTVVTVKENQINYKFDFAKVYWNPRLSTEHDKISKMFNRNDALYDVFAGVGPFSIPAAKRRAWVFANDLNPESYKWLKHNFATNKVSYNTYKCFNMDGREFIKTIVKANLLKRRKGEILVENIYPEHIVMNLPASAVDFLDVFEDWLTAEEEKIIFPDSRSITIHVYCFVKPEDDEESVAKAKLLVEEKLGYSLNPEILKEICHVRKVAPNKEMMRVSFLLTSRKYNRGEPAKKIIKTDDNIDVHNQVAGQDEEQRREANETEKCIQGKPAEIV